MDHMHGVHSYNRPSRVVALPDSLSFYNTTGLDASCPYGFVIPDHPSDPDTEWVEGTNCAIGCISPVYERSKYVGGQYLIDFIAWCGFILICVNLLSHRVSTRKPVHYLKLFNLALAMVATVINMITSFFPVEDRFCRDNANGITGRDGINFCTFSSVLLIYVTIGTMICWTIQILVLFNSIVLNQSPNDAARDKPNFMFIIFAVPVIPTIILIASGNIGYRKGGSSCFTNQVADDNNLDIWCYWVVAAVMAGLSTLLLVGIFWKAITVIMFSKIDPTTRPKIPFSGAMRPESSNVSSMSGDTDDLKSRSGTASLESPVGASLEIDTADDKGGDKYRAVPAVGEEGTSTASTGSTKSSRAVGLSAVFSLLFTPPSAKVAPGGSELATSQMTMSDRSGVKTDGEDFAAGPLARLKILAAPTLFSLVYLSMVIGGLYGRFELYETYDSRWHVFNRWIQCIFENYYNNYTADLEASGSVDSAAYFDMDARQEFAYAVCDMEPESPVSDSAIIWFFVCIFGYPIWVSIVFMKPKFVKILICGH